MARRNLISMLATLAFVASGCGDDAASPGGDGGIPDASVPGDGGMSDAAPTPDTGATADAAPIPDGSIADGGGVDAGPPPMLDYFTPGEPETIGTACVPPALLNLDEIPVDTMLDDGDEDTLAIFEVDGDELISKFVRDEAAAEGALRLWQEVVLRIPANQRIDLVQYEVFHNSGQAAYFNRNFNITTRRMGLKIGFHTDNFERNDPDPCAPLVPRRGTFDWSLVHEFGHLIGWVDGSWPRFLATWPDVRGDGDGYPEDGSPILTGEFVTSYAERADGDEDYAESFTTWVMLPASAIPASMAGGPLSVEKIHWIAAQPNLAAVRQAIRITEPDGGDTTVQAAPRLFDESPVEVPAWLHGTWEGVVEGDSVTRRFEFTADDVIETHVEGGVETFRESLKETHLQRLLEGSVLDVSSHLYAEPPHFVLNVHYADDDLHNNDFINESAGLLWSRARFADDGEPFETLQAVLERR